MKKIYECCICHNEIDRNKRLVYQEFDNKGKYGFFHNICNYDMCDECFKIFVSWIMRHRNDLEIGVEINLKKER